ncbi:MAG: Tim44 domain-containing protein [Alphaproteobacteria bacterium]|nr:Tim44 domain-containing protein [Alphaproteobacteria bacterium]
MHIDIDIVVYAVIAVLLLGRLWVLLGRRDEDEPRQPNPFAQPPEAKKPAPKQDDSDAPFAGGNTQTQDADAEHALPLSPLLHPELPPASLAGGLAQVKAVDASFDEKQFLQNARATFTAIVTAYATGDMDGVAPLLSPALLSHFRQAAGARRAAGQTAQTRVLNIKEAEAVAARAEGSQAYVIVKFVSDQENILRDAHGTVIGGGEGKTEEVTDTWAFSRDASQPDSQWVVVETRG